MTSISQHAAEIKRTMGGLLNGRIDAGQALALTGHVTQVDADHWTVDSQTEPGKSYQVSWAAGAWHCTCPDHLGTGYRPAPPVEFGGGVQETCKHILAAALCYFSAEYPIKPAADLIIVTRRAAQMAGNVQSKDGKILWWKLANQEKTTPPGTLRLSDTVILGKLAKYELIKQECASTEIWHFYQLKDLGAAPGDGGVSEADLSRPLSPEYLRLVKQEDARRQALPGWVDNRQSIEEAA